MYNKIISLNLHGNFMIERKSYIQKINQAFEVSPVCAILGPRQCGKTTLAKKYIKSHFNQHHIFDLEDPTDLARLENPKLTLENLKGIIIIDEIQRRPELFPYIRVLVDNHNDKNFLILGSASRELIRQSSETLAGRIQYIDMMPFSINEVPDIQKLWSQGGYPRSYLADNDRISNEWRKNYIRTFLEMDLPNFGFNITTQRIRRFWMMLAHYHGQSFNASEIGRAIDITYKTTSHYLDILVSTFMVRRLSPWFENIGKRQVKTPKIYFRDSGLLHSILGINNYHDLQLNPKLGFSWEGFALEQIIRCQNIDDEDCYFWGSSNGAKLDLLIIKNNKKFGYEFKYTDSPKITKSMHIALQELKLENLKIIIPGNQTFKLHDKISVVGLNNCADFKLE